MNNMEKIELPIHPSHSQDDAVLREKKEFEISGNETSVKAVIQASQKLELVINNNRKVKLNNGNYSIRINDEFNSKYPLSMQGLDVILKEKFGFTLSEIMRNKKRDQAQGMGM